MSLKSIFVNVLPVGLALLIVASFSLKAQATVAVDSKTSSQVESCDSEKPWVIYLDDVSASFESVYIDSKPATHEEAAKVNPGRVVRVPRGDPNGILDLAIALGFSEYMHLKAIGLTTFTAVENSKNLATQLLKRAHFKQDLLYSGQALIDKIIAEANSAKSCGRKLNIAIGGEWSVLYCALKQDPSIASTLEVAGLKGWNIDPRTRRSAFGERLELKACGVTIEKGPLKPGQSKFYERSPRASYNGVLNYLKPEQIYGIEDMLYVDRKLINPNTHFRWAYTFEKDRYSVADLDKFYDQAFTPLLKNLIDPHRPEIPITDERSFFIAHSRSLTLSQGQGDRSINKASKLRMADYLALAHILWGKKDQNFNIYDKDQTYPKILESLKKLH